jgi:hypothetical protein
MPCVIQPFSHWAPHAITFVVIFISSLAAMTLIFAAAPGLILRVRQTARSGMRRCFIWGLVFVINAILLAALLAYIGGPAGEIIALTVLVVLLVVTLSGLASVATEIGKRVMALANKHDSNRLVQLHVGTVILFATAMVPILGWLVFASALLTGIGGFLEAVVSEPDGKHIPDHVPLQNDSEPTCLTDPDIV